MQMIGENMSGGIRPILSWCQANTKMRHITYILTFLILTSCGQSNSEKDFKQKVSVETDPLKVLPKVDTLNLNLNQEPTKQTDYNNQDLSYEFRDVTIFKLTDTITADFNGDGNVDKAIIKKNKETSGIIITHGETNEEIKFGFGQRIANLTEFNWVDFWDLLKDSETYEIVIEDAEIKGDRKVMLENPSIVVRKEEAGGGLITFKEGKYVWIHQAD